MNEFESKLILHEPDDTSVGPSDTQVFLNRLAAASQATELITLAADEAETEPERTAEAEVDDVKGRMSLSADAPPYNTACEELALDPLSPVLVVPSNMMQACTTLKKWQVTGTCWMLRQEASPVAGGILADACGTGKTTSTITLLWYASIRAAKYPMHTHKPTLILCHSALVDTWLTELTASSITLDVATPSDLKGKRRRADDEPSPTPSKKLKRNPLDGDMLRWPIGVATFERLPSLRVARRDLLRFVDSVEQQITLLEEAEANALASDEEEDDPNHSYWVEAAATLRGKSTDP
ncbi:hypothetical protein Aspvir_003445 [Aspergillus viridinutans]|uniref:SNF2 N-terminal domain-containing protein n=1 Tax=Aspergillus viridinutans TaxID=75553 RepID=A0A9P3C551_ASPVI|nr:uncharacterized protein Aspvir_003445 [Aspergillus viridinutans]GIK07777.1 hypothetical protein Aspvir_003445 [Aspergillus viridinutans]